MGIQVWCYSFWEVYSRVFPDLLVTLENPHLRSLMTNLVSSPSPAKDMDRAMKEPIFLEFADQCLKVVDNNSQVKAGINVKNTG